MSWIKGIEGFRPYNEQEKKDKELILQYIHQFNDILTRDNQLVHITSSGFVLNKEKDKVLMVHHNIFNAWSLPGGHADGEEDLLNVAIKEVQEETGVMNVAPITIDIIALDILPVLGHMKKGQYNSAHLHLSVVYLLEVDEDEPLTVKKDENSDVKWIPIDEVVKCSNEPHMQKVYNKIISKINFQL
ncbi:ADP-ribose pyrophosphatase YjhB (NUDIX family) [Natranaerovirga pectinivora]|uniref:ADP-ribose pyrophosphatase YjhB (NUDIX family) n=1 Tax=Natranaerovirga pectinivora TaxID=682400 RepID=A0A4V2V0E6_9FIRM|nr:NUDIX hydrolase [Natranaerovirga pectinivora]TCT15590.1 ADP-ribose pyrophosphatase YjhB (NUDIX family) [Natranaerovirga pectinivora]